jgi:hypothetical protein
VLNTNLDEICAEIGYTATTALVVWFGGAYLQVPPRADPDSPLAHLIGAPALRRLVACYGNRRIWIGAHTQADREARDRRIAESLAQGMRPRDIAKALPCSRRRVEQIRTRLLAARALSVVCGASPLPGVAVCETTDDSPRSGG